MREIRPINHNGSIQLKFSVAGKRYSFNPICGGDFSNKRDMASAYAIAVKIQNDILAGCFDRTLDKYRLVAKVKVEPDSKARPTDMLQLWDAWVDTLNITSATKADHYEMIRRMIVKAKPGLTDADWLKCAAIAPATFNKRLSYVKSCFVWAIKEGLVKDNPCTQIKLRKTTIAPVKPFTEDEIKAILHNFDAITPHYSPFVRFLFLTGVRLSEAIGLRWGAICTNSGDITICESLSKDRTGNGYNRIRKETKTGSVRHLKMNSELLNLLLSLQPSSSPDPDHLVFTTIQGCVVDSGNFRGLWQKVLKAARVPYRRPHIIRHTLLSHAVEQGIPLTGVAYIAGHANTRMVMQTYGHMVNRPNLPVMPV